MAPLEYGTTDPVIAPNRSWQRAVPILSALCLAGLGLAAAVAPSFQPPSNYLWTTTAPPVPRAGVLAFPNQMRSAGPTAPRSHSSRAYAGPAAPSRTTRYRVRLNGQAGDGTDLGPRRKQIIDALKLEDVVVELQDLGVQYGDLFEKEDLVDRLLAARAAIANGGVVLNMPLTKSGIPMLDQTGQSAEYYVLNASFIDSPHPYDILQLMVDTASPTSIIADDVANRHAAKETGIRDPAGNWYQVDMGRLSLSDQDVGVQFQPVVANIPIYPGLLGLDFIASHDVMFDFTGQRCVLYPAGVANALKVVEGMAKAIIRELPNGRWAVEGFGYFEGQRGSAQIQMVLDTGASVSVMNWAAAKTLGLAADSPAVSRKGYLKDAGKQLAEVPAAFTIGTESDPKPVTIAIADLPGFTEVGLQQQPAMILGADLLRQRGEVVLSAIGAQMWIKQ